MELANPNPRILLVKSMGETLFWAKKNYYNGFPTLADEAYDSLEDQMKLLCPTHPILECVGDPDFSFLFGMEATRSFCSANEIVENAEDAL